MKVTFDVKKSFMKQLSKLKDVDESSPFKNISISHDMTKNGRDQNNDEACTSNQFFLY
jgi:hypothetical protein